MVIYLYPVERYDLALSCGWYQDVLLPCETSSACSPSWPPPAPGSCLVTSLPNASELEVEDAGDERNQFGAPFAFLLWMRTSICRVRGVQWGWNSSILLVVTSHDGTKVNIIKTTQRAIERVLMHRCIDDRATGGTAQQIRQFAPRLAAGCQRMLTRKRRQRRQRYSGIVNRALYLQYVCATKAIHY
jgi:hypothetical protein